MIGNGFVNNNTVEKNLLEKKVVLKYSNNETTTQIIMLGNVCRNVLCWLYSPDRRENPF